jgi:hypothetical protein
LAYKVIEIKKKNCAVLVFRMVLSRIYEEPPENVIENFAVSFVQRAAGFSGAQLGRFLTSRKN